MMEGGNRPEGPHIEVVYSKKCSHPVGARRTNMTPGRLSIRVPLWCKLIQSMNKSISQSTAIEGQGTQEYRHGVANTVYLKSSLPPHNTLKETHMHKQIGGVDQTHLKTVG